MTPGIYEFGPCQSVMAYGGRSGEIERRWQSHSSMLRRDKHHCEHLQNAWDLYGEDVFVFRILEVIEDPDERVVAEQAWLDKRHADKTCYNSAITAGPGGPRSEETKQKIREARIGMEFTEEHKHNMSIAKMGNQNSLGYKHTDAAKHNMSIAKMGNQGARGNQNALGNQYWLGRKHADASKQKMSAARKRWWAKKKASEESEQRAALTASSSEARMWQPR